MRIGVICPSEIAIRRFMPALKQSKEFSFAGVGVLTSEECFGRNDMTDEEFKRIYQSEQEKAQVFVDQYGGEIYEGYNQVVKAENVDALYIPLPPALHYQWAKLAIEYGKHVLVEKPSTTSVIQTQELIGIAKEKQLAIHENYMFAFHKQLDAINKIVESGEIGDVRLYRISFGFPRRSANDFRYNKALGGGALIDAGGYTIRYATMLLGDTAEIKYAQLNYLDEYEVDIYGSAALVNAKGVTAQIAFGMDNNYKCELEVWGSKGCLTTGRILTAPAGFVPTAIIRKGDAVETIELPSDDTFKKSIDHFRKCIIQTKTREDNYQIINKQAELVEQFRELAYKKQPKPAR